MVSEVDPPTVVRSEEEHHVARSRMEDSELIALCRLPLIVVAVAASVAQEEVCGENKENNAKLINSLISGGFNSGMNRQGGGGGGFYSNPGQAPIDHWQAPQA